MTRRLWYLVMLEGGPIERPANLRVVGKPIQWLGFVTTRKALAKSVSEAVSLATEDALAELQETLLSSQSESSPQCCVVEVRTLTWIRAAIRSYRGFTFCPWANTASDVH